MSEENNNNNDASEIDKVINSEAGKEKIQALINEAISKQKEEFEKELSGIKNNKEEILKEKKVLQDKVNKILLESGNVEEITKKIREERDAEWREKFEAIDNENKTLKTSIDSFKNAQKISKLHDLSIKEVSKYNIHTASIEDVKERFAKEFDLDEDGKIKHKENKLNEQGKDYSVDDFYKDLQKNKPHWFNGVSGSGTTTTNKTVSKELTAEQIKNMTRAEYQKAKKDGLIKF